MTDDALKKAASDYAREWAKSTTLHASTAEIHMRLAFEAGAQWALEQMTSEAAFVAASNELRVSGSLRLALAASVWVLVPKPGGAP
jgi:imidazolonepropionase-like amidohydrolase